MPEKILIVDDDLDSLKLIGLMLQRQGYEVIAASTGSQALTKADAEHPDLVILDVMMPDLNGYEVCRRLRENPETQSTPILMFTAKTLIDDKVAGFEAGADDYLTKPTHPAELAARVKSMLSRAGSSASRPVGSGTTIGVIGAKGGVGTTTIALNIAAGLVQHGVKPIVADFRLGSGSLGLMLGQYTAAGMANLLSRPTTEIRPALVERELVAHQSGIRALLSSTRPKEAQLNFPIESALTLIEVLNGLTTHTVYDLGTGFTTLNSHLLPAMDQLVMLIEPLTSTVKMAQEFSREIKIAYKRSAELVVVSRSQSKIQLPWHEVEAMMGQEIKAIIAAAPELAFEAAEAGVPIVVHQPTAIVANQIIKLAADLQVHHDYTE